MMINEKKELTLLCLLILETSKRLQKIAVFYLWVKAMSLLNLPSSSVILWQINIKKERKIIFKSITKTNLESNIVVSETSFFSWKTVLFYLSSVNEFSLEGSTLYNLLPCWQRFARLKRLMMIHTDFEYALCYVFLCAMVSLCMKVIPLSSQFSPIMLWKIDAK